MTTGQVRLSTFDNSPFRSGTPPVWLAARSAGVGALGTLLVALVVVPQAGLFVFWDVLVPLLPVLLVLAPGAWRNVCPVAAVSQVPRLLGRSRAGPAPRWVRRHGYLIGAAAFVGIVATRTLVFERSGPALAVLLAIVLLAAAGGGVAIKGKAGWCTTLCPMVPVERLYGQAPLVAVANRHCQPCVGCTRHCYDLNPHTAHLAAEHDVDPRQALRRRLFAGAFPGLTLWLFVTPAASFKLLAVMLLASVGSFFVLDAVLPLSRAALPALYGAVTLNLFYWFTTPPWLGPRLGLSFRAAVLTLSLLWLGKTLRTAHAAEAPPPRPRMLPLIDEARPAAKP